VNLYLQSQWQQVMSTNLAAANNNQTQNSGQPVQNSNSANTMISVFNLNLRNEIQDKARICTDSIFANSANPGQNTSNIDKACGDINDKIKALESTVSWATGATQEMANTPGLTEQSLQSLNQNWNETSRLAQSAINKSITFANELLTKLTQPDKTSTGTANSAKTEQTPAAEALKETASTLNSASQTAEAVTKTTAENTTPATTAQAATKETAETKETEKTAEAKTDEKVKATEDTQKAAEATNKVTDAIATNNIDTKATKLDLNS